VAPLEPGDHLTRDEFERRFDATPGLKKAELIEGVVYMAPPVRADSHGYPHADLMGLLFVYRAATPGVRVTDNASVRLDLDNEPQPDAAMTIESACGGQSTLSKDGYIQGAPELAAEVSGSSVSMDLNTKFRAYRRNKIREYIVWRVYDEVIDWFELEKGDYIPLPAHEGIVRSRVFPGLWLDPAALVRGDVATALAVLQKGIASPEHAEFVKTLESRRKATGR
jgi:Uma2 family endonuclease